MASSSAVCPACGKAVDALRAGQVAILDGAFRYFCDASCKSSYVDVLSKRPALDAMTAEPPTVLVGGAASDTPGAPRASRSVVVHVPSGVREQEPEASGIAERFDEDEYDEEESVSEPPAEEEPTAEDEEEDDDDEAARAQSARGGRRTEDDDAPLTLRSPSVVPDEAVRPKKRRSWLRALTAWLRRLFLRLVEHVLGAAPIAGIFAGVLAAVVSLAGERAAVLRLPLALVSALTLVVRRRHRDHGEPAWWVVLAPIGAAAVFATVSVLTQEAHAEAHASFVGLAAASALTVDILLSRARRDIVHVRARTSRALAVTARIVRGDSIVEVDASLVKPGDQVVVEAGETVAVDGIVVAASDAKVAPWLDSPSLVEKVEGDAIVAGAAVVSGRLRLNATFSGAERAWLRLTTPVNRRAPNAPAIFESIENAAPLVALARRVVERAAPAAGILVGAAVYADNGSWLDVAIAACGAGYALAAVAGVAAAALAHARGHATAQTRGIVYKDANAFDAAARADVAVVCSRGTILLGEPEIVAIEPITKEGWLRTPKPGAAGGANPAPGGRLAEEVARVLAIAAGAEMSSNHPFASAILREARARGVRPDNVRSALGHSGLGVTALASNGDRIIVGSRAFLLQEKVSVAIADARTSELEAQGRSVLLVAAGGRLVGLLALQDGLRPGARAAIQRMHDARIEPVLLSGEARDTCETIARALDIEHVRPEILPGDRAAEVRALADGGRVVATVGHASSDDGALGAADVSIAMEAAGAAPGEWAVALASDDVRDAALAMTVPRGCRDRARTALLAGGLTQAAGALAIAFGVAPPAVVPVLGVLATAAVVSLVRDPVSRS